MSLESIELGRLADPEEDDQTQEEVNEDSLFIYDQNQLLTAIEYRVSRYDLLYFMEQIIGSDIEYWYLVLRKIIHVYSINSLKPYLSRDFSPNVNKHEIQKLLIFIKLKLVDLFEDKTLNNNITIDNLLEEISKYHPPFLLTEALKFIDTESYNLMIKRLINESQEQFGNE